MNCLGSSNLVQRGATTSSQRSPGRSAKSGEIEKREPPLSSDPPLTSRPQSSRSPVLLRSEIPALRELGVAISGPPRVSASLSPPRLNDASMFKRQKLLSTRLVKVTSDVN